MFEFTEVIRKGTGHNLSFPERVVRFSRKTMSIDTASVPGLRAYTYETPASARDEDTELAKIGLAYDVRNQAIKVYPKEDGYTLRIMGGRIGYLSLPSALRKAGLPMGDYKQTDEDPNVFVLVR